MQQVGQWSVKIHVHDAAATQWTSDSHALAARDEGGHLVLTADAQHVKPDKDVVLDLHKSESGSLPGEPSPASIGA